MDAEHKARIVRADTVAFMERSPFLCGTCEEQEERIGTETTVAITQKGKKVQGGVTIPEIRTGAREDEESGSPAWLE
jgi:hypothetical protein